MMKSFLRSIGVADDFVEHLDQVELAFQRPAFLWVGLFLLIPIGYFIYRRQQRSLNTVPKKFRIALTVTRVIVLAILFGVSAGPYLKIDHQVTKRPIVAILFDTSQSMQLPAGPFTSDEELFDVATASVKGASTCARPSDFRPIFECSVDKNGLQCLPICGTDICNLRYPPYRRTSSRSYGGTKS